MINEKLSFDDSEDKEIKISLGKWEESVSYVDEYIAKRRFLLAKIDSPEEYYEFMGTCFVNSYFADNVLDEMKRIKDFPDYVKEITDNLAVLNDEAIQLYNKYKNNLKTAIAELSSKMKACSLDPKHREDLWFPFTYEEYEDGEKRDVHIDVRCEPHMKLVREDSDLRIYFYWKDDRIEGGKKVLIGRIGRHPWDK